MNVTKGLTKGWTDPNQPEIVLSNGFHVITRIILIPEKHVTFTVEIFVSETSFDDADIQSYSQKLFDIPSTDEDFGTYFAHSVTSGLDTNDTECAYSYLKSLTSYDGALTVYV